MGAHTTTFQAEICTIDRYASLNLEKNNMGQNSMIIKGEQQFFKNRCNFHYYYQYGCTIRLNSLLKNFPANEICIIKLHQQFWVQDSDESGCLALSQEPPINMNLYRILQSALQKPFSFLRSSTFSGLRITDIFLLLLQLFGPVSIRVKVFLAYFNGSLYFQEANSGVHRHLILTEHS